MKLKTDYKSMNLPDLLDTARTGGELAAALAELIEEQREEIEKMKAIIGEAEDYLRGQLTDIGEQSAKIESHLAKLEEYND